MGNHKVNKCKYVPEIIKMVYPNEIKLDISGLYK